jgi:hypothetical protein
MLVSTGLSAFPAGSDVRKIMLINFEPIKARWVDWLEHYDSRWRNILDESEMLYILFQII